MIVGHTIIDAQGEILSFVSVPEADLAANIPAGATSVAGAPADWQSYRAGAAWVQKPPAPSPMHAWDRTAKAWVDPRTPAQATADAAAIVRTQRDALLAACDWTQLADAPATNRGQWTAYRAALRNVPQQPGFPGTVSWPAPPQ